MNKAYIYRIYPNTEQSTLINKTFNCVGSIRSFVYNQMLSQLFLLLMSIITLMMIVVLYTILRKVFLQIFSKRLTTVKSYPFL